MAKSARSIPNKAVPGRPAAEAGALGVPADPLAVLQATLAPMRDTTHLADLLERTVAALHAALANRTTAVLQLNPDQITLTCRTQRGASACPGAPVPLASGLIGAAVGLRQTIVSNEPAADPRYQPHGDDAVRAALCLPLSTRHELWGVLSLESAQPGAYPPALVRAAELIAQQLAIAIEHMSQAEQMLQKQAELITTSKLTAVGTLAAGVAHEFNNLLAGIQGYAELGYSGTVEEKDEALDIVRRTCRRGVQLTRRLLTFARQTDGARELIAVDEIAEGAMQLIGWDLVRANLSIVRDYQSHALVHVEPGQLMQVVLNLLSNARDATPPGGTITIATAERGDWIELSVADTGTGIAEHIQPRIFEPFITTKGAFGGGDSVGTGLGLSVSYGIVRTHGGRLLVESAPGQGSRFTIQVARPPAQIEPEAQPHRPLLPALRILIVDDEAHERQLIVRLLAQDGHMLVQAGSGAEALALKAQETWDLIIADVSMPAMGGLELAKQLRARGMATPIVLLAEPNQDHDRIEAAAPAAATVLDKPFTKQKLVQMIAATLAAYA